MRNTALAEGKVMAESLAISRNVDHCAIGAARHAVE
jgi:hypothetical protein